MSSDSDSDSSEKEVLTLQTSALHYISRNIREFAPRELAYLPVRLRAILFSSLPAVDICRFEDFGDLYGPVCDGVCLSEVWGDVYIHRLITLPPYVESELSRAESLGERDMGSRLPCNLWGNDDLEWKEEKIDVLETNRENVLARIANCVFMNDRNCKMTALKALFRVPHVPTTRSLSTDSYSDMELIRVLKNKCIYYPSVLYLSCERFFNSSLWERREESFPLLAKFFSDLTHLSIVDSDEDIVDSIEYFGVFRFILEAVFSSKEPALTHLEVHCCEIFMTKAITDMAYFMSSQSAVVAEFTHGSLTTQYSRLKVLSLAALDDAEGREAEHQLVSECFSNLRQIIEHQDALRSLHIGAWFNDPVCPEHDQLMHSVSLLYRQPTFCRLEFREISLCSSSGNSSAIFKAIMHEFLCGPSQGQELELDTIYGNELTQDHFGGVCACSRCKSPNIKAGSKLLHFGGFGTMEIDAFFSRCLSHFPGSSLGAIVLDSVEHCTDEALAAIVSLPSVKTLYFIHVTFVFNGSLEVVERLFTMPHLAKLTLQTLALDGDAFPAANSDKWALFIELVTRGLCKQMAIGQLKDFNFSRNRFRVSSGQVKDLLNALFSQPQLEMMTVCFNSTLLLLPKKEFSLVLNCWKQHANGKRLNWLEVIGSDDQDLWEGWRENLIKISQYAHIGN